MYTHDLSHGPVDLKDDKCFHCSKLAGSEGLHNTLFYCTYNIKAKVHRCAIELEDTAVVNPKWFLGLQQKPPLKFI